MAVNPSASTGNPLSCQAQHLVPPTFHAADAAGVPIRAIFDIADGKGDIAQSERALQIAQACLGGWLRHAHLADLELTPTEEEFVRVEARRRMVFKEVAMVLAAVEAVQIRGCSI